MLCRMSRASSCWNSAETGGRFSTMTWAMACAFNPRGSLQIAVTLMVPAPEVFSAAVLPLPETAPSLAVQQLTVTGRLSGLAQAQLMMEGEPAGIAAGFDDHDIEGGFFGASFTVKLALQVA